MAITPSNPETPPVGGSFFDWLPDEIIHQEIVPRLRGNSRFNFELTCKNFFKTVIQLAEAAAALDKSASALAEDDQADLIGSTPDLDRFYQIFKQRLKQLGIFPSKMQHDKLSRARSDLFPPFGPPWGGPEAIKRMKKLEAINDGLKRKSVEDIWAFYLAELRGNFTIPNLKRIVDLLESSLGVTKETFEAELCKRIRTLLTLEGIAALRQTYSELTPEAPLFLTAKREIEQGFIARKEFIKSLWHGNRVRADHAEQEMKKAEEAYLKVSSELIGGLGEISLELLQTNFLKYDSQLPVDYFLSTTANFPLFEDFCKNYKLFTVWGEQKNLWERMYSNDDAPIKLAAIDQKLADPAVITKKAQSLVTIMIVLLDALGQGSNHGIGSACRQYSDVIWQD